MTNGRSRTLGKAARSSWSGSTGESRRFMTRLGPATGEGEGAMRGCCGAGEAEARGVVVRLIS
jgi:hypothetical protein